MKDGRLNGGNEPYDLLPVVSGGNETQPIKSGGSRTYLLGKLLSIPLTPKEREENPYKRDHVHLHLGKKEFSLVKEGETAFFSVVARSEGFIDGFEKVYKVQLDENGVLTGPEEVKESIGWGVPD